MGNRRWYTEGHLACGCSCRWVVALNLLLACACPCSFLLALMRQHGQLLRQPRCWQE
jgi:hypothetical protein